MTGKPAVAILALEAARLAACPSVEMKAREIAERLAASR
jgi:hypothetical protein